MMLSFFLFLFTLTGCSLNLDLSHLSRVLEQRGEDPNLFIATFNTQKLSPNSSGDSQITLPLILGEQYDFIVDWGDGKKDEIKSALAPEKTHTYTHPGIYEIKLLGSFPRLAFENSGDRLKILDVKQWGTNEWSSMESMFEGCVYLKISAKDKPDLSNVQSLNSMFAMASLFNSPIGHWDTANVTDMGNMFLATFKFNQPLKEWNTSNVNDMERMFMAAFAFDQDLSSWDLSSLEFADDFDEGASVWRKPRPVGLSTSPDVPNGPALISYPTDAFVSFWQIDAPNTSITLPLKSGTPYSFKVIWGDGSPPQTVSAWNSSSKTHLYTQPGKYLITLQGSFPILDFGSSAHKLKIVDIINWGSNQWASVDHMFSGCENLQMSALDAPNLSHVDSLEGMFNNAHIFNAPIGHWDTSNIKNMRDMFRQAYAFNQPLSNWDTSQVRFMSSMFDTATSFNQPLENWNVANVSDMSAMFYQAVSFNQPLAGWNTASVKNMQSMFFLSYSFNQPLNNWNTSNVEEMKFMFFNALTFNQPLEKWMTRNVQSMDYMFHSAYSFDQNLSSWDLTNLYSSKFFDEDALAWTLPKPDFPPQ